METNQKLQLAKEWYNDPSTTKEEKSHLEKIFPELKEMVKNEIIAFVVQSIHRGGGTPIPKEQENRWLCWLEKQGDKHTEPVTVVERDGERWVRVCAFGEDFIIASHDYREGDKTEFTWEEACKTGTFSKKQGYIMLALKDEINARLEEIGGEPLASYYWSSSEYYQNGAWVVNFGSGSVYGGTKSGSGVARAVAAF